MPHLNINNLRVFANRERLFRLSGRNTPTVSGVNRLVADTVRAYWRKLLVGLGSHPLPVPVH